MISEEQNQEKGLVGKMSSEAFNDCTKIGKYIGKQVLKWGTSPITGNLSTSLRKRIGLEGIDATRFVSSLTNFPLYMLIGHAIFPEISEFLEILPKYSHGAQLGFLYATVE